MKPKNRRKYPRVKICNPISYDCVDQDGNLIDQNMAVALDVSQNGILLETPQKIESKTISLLFVDLENELVEILGAVVFSIKKKDMKFKSGINFQGTHDENIHFAKKVIQAYHSQKSDPVFINGVQA
jgi:c-di-GMP-binding flagellar brake protein YcgR